MNNCRDVAELYLFASGLSDTFPRDALSMPGSKYIDIQQKVVNVDMCDNNNQCDNMDNTRDKDTVIVSNKIRDQDVQIRKLKEELISTRNEMVKKLNGMEHLLHLLLTHHGIVTNNKCAHEQNQSITPGKSSKLSKGTIPNSEHFNSNHEFETRSQLPGLSCGRAGEEVVPPGRVITDQIETDRPTGVSTHDEHYDEADVFCVIKDDTDDSSSPGAMVGNQTTDRSLYSDAAISQGPWQQQKSKDKKHRRKYRDERDRFISQPTNITPQKNELKGATKEILTGIYVGNIETSENDTDETIVNKVRNHCMVHKVRVVRINVIYNRYNDYVVSCKISVPMSDKQKILSDGFWPSQIRCREWQRRVTHDNNHFVKYDDETSTLSRTVRNVDTNSGTSVFI